MMDGSYMIMDDRCMHNGWMNRWMVDQWWIPHLQMNDGMIMSSGCWNGRWGMGEWVSVRWWRDDGGVMDEEWMIDGLMGAWMMSGWMCGWMDDRWMYGWMDGGCGDNGWWVSGCCLGGVMVWILGVSQKLMYETMQERLKIMRVLT